MLPVEVDLQATAAALSNRGALSEVEAADESAIVVVVSGFTTTVFDKYNMLHLSNDELAQLLGVGRA